MELRNKYFPGIYIREDTHQYMIAGHPNLQPTSATTIIKSLHKQFDAPYWATYKALEEIHMRKPVGDFADDVAEGHIRVGREQHSYQVWLERPEVRRVADQIRLMWKKDAKWAGDKGSYIHEIAEKLATGKIPPIKTQFLDYRAALMAFWKREKFSQGRIAAYELLIGCPEWEVCGMIDLLTHAEGGGYNLEDWKTNKRIDTESYQNRDKMFPPIDFLDDCNLNHYVVQLNIYKAIFEKITGLPIRDMRLHHITDGGVVTYSIQGIQPQILEILTKKIWQQ